MSSSDYSQWKNPTQPPAVLRRLRVHYDRLCVAHYLKFNPHTKEWMLAVKLPEDVFIIDRFTLVADLPFMYDDDLGGGDHCHE